MQRMSRIENGLSEKQRRVLQQMRKVKDIVQTPDKNGLVKPVPVMNERLVVTEIEETEMRAIDDILNIEEALTRVTDKRLKAIRQKYDMIRLMDEHRIEVTAASIFPMRQNRQKLERLDCPPCGQFCEYHNYS